MVPGASPFRRERQAASIRPEIRSAFRDSALESIRFPNFLKEKL